MKNLSQSHKILISCQVGQDGTVRRDVEMSSPACQMRSKRSWKVYQAQFLHTFRPSLWQSSSGTSPHGTKLLAPSLRGASPYSLPHNPNNGLFSEILFTLLLTQTEERLCQHYSWVVCTQLHLKQEKNIKKQLIHQVSVGNEVSSGNRNDHKHGGAVFRESHPSQQTLWVTARRGRTKTVYHQHNQCDISTHNGREGERAVESCASLINFNFSGAFRKLSSLP